MKSPGPYFRLICAAVLAIGIFYVDVQVKLGIATPILYILFIWCIASIGLADYIILSALFCSILTIGGLFLFPPGDDFLYIIVNRILSLKAIWFSAILCRRNYILQQKEIERNKSIEKVAMQLENSNRDLRNERKKLAASEQRFRAAVESAPSAMIMVDNNGEIISANNEAEIQLGYQPGTLQHQHIGALIPERFSNNHPLIRHTSNAVLHEIDQNNAKNDVYLMRRDGSEFPAEIGFSPFETGEGTLSLSVIVDITERRRLEAAQKELNEELERRVAARTSELQKSNEALENSNVELERFAYVASHDLQTPLRAIGNFVEMLRDELDDRTNEQANLYISRIVKNCHRMSFLINDLLTYSRLQAEARPFSMVDLNDVMGEVSGLMREAIEESGGELITCELPVVFGDASQLTSLLQNLVGNALKYRSEAPPIVRIGCEESEDFWIISVTDNGIGIDPEYHDRIFKIFQRLHTNREYSGTGIGLSVCRRIAIRHGGKIEVESEVGKGAKFSFYCPK